MKEIDRKKYYHFLEYARQCKSNAVYPMSIAESIQSGDIFTNDSGQAVLFWHYCGFAYLSGELTPEFLNEIYQVFYCCETKNRFILITEDPDVVRFFREKENILVNERAEYTFDNLKHDNITLPDYYRIERITDKNIYEIHGKIVPSFSWNDEAAFLKNGFGYAAFYGNDFAGVAFSAAISSDEVDIGIETAEEYRGQGIAKALGSRMCREIIESGKKPVWAHAVSNVGSRRTALSIGFTCKQINYVIRYYL